MRKPPDKRTEKNREVRVVKHWVLIALICILGISEARAQSQVTAIPNLPAATLPIHNNDLFILYQPANAGLKTTNIPYSALGIPLPVAPTITGCTGLSGGSCGLANGSTNAAGEITINNGAGLGSGTGTITLAFNATLGPEGSSCSFTLANNGAFLWPSASVAAAGARNGASHQVQWIYGIGVNFPASVTLAIEYQCRGY